MCAKQAVPRVTILITPADVLEVAETVASLPEDFEPVAWLIENLDNITLVAKEAVKDVLYEALEIGLDDHPLVLRYLMED
jgi:hypothetical protein